VCACMDAGGGGTQRLLRAVGKSKAMELILTGDMMGAAEALQFGLVARVVPVPELLPAAFKLGDKIAALSKPIIRMAKEATAAGYEMSLHEGLERERRLFHSTFATADQKEGMGAFAEKRKPAFKNL
jgi:enoyl-CoA hydratase